MKNIILIGFMCSGKSSIGQGLSELLNMELVDSDKFIESIHGLSVENIFKIFGENYFRKVEKIFLDLYSNTKNKIISTGGGLPIFNNIPKKLGTIFYLNCDFEIILNRLKNDTESKRPLYKNKDSFKKLFLDRQNSYEQSADFIINANLSKEKILKNILEKLPC